MDLKSNYETNDKDPKPDLIVFQVVHADLIMRLQELIQYPLTCPFAFEDLQWTQQVLSGNGRYNTINYVVIPWERLHDFIVGEQNNDLFPCKFTKKIIKKNLPNSLSNPRANTPSIATTLCIHFNPVNWPFLKLMHHHLFILMFACKS